jgi:hypothetical protein
VECRTLPGTRAEKSPQLPSKAQQEGQAKHGKHGARDHEHPPTPGIAIHLGIVKADVQGLRIAVQEEMPVGQGRVAKDRAERSRAQGNEGCDGIGDDLLAGAIGIHVCFFATNSRVHKRTL